MKRRVWVLTAFVLLSCLSVGAAMAVGDIKLPVWPQSFALAPGDRVSFAIPVTQPGDVTADVSWSGGPLNVVLLGPGAPLPNPLTPQAGPVKISRTAVPADVANGLLWTLVIIDPRQPLSRPNPALTVRGQVNAQYPRVDLDSLAKWLPTFISRQQASFNAMRSQTISQAASSLSAMSTKAQQDENNKIKALNAQSIALVKAQLGKELQERAMALAKIKASMVAPIGTGSRAILAAGSNQIGPKAGNALEHARDLPKIPVLVSVAPGNGYAGDEVWVEAQNLETQANFYQAEFSIAQNMKGKGQVKRLETRNGKTGLVVTVAEEVPNATAGFTGPLVIKRVDPNDGTEFGASNPLTFALNTRPCPTISYVTPSDVLPNTELAITGSNFSATCKTHILFPDGRHEIIANNDDSTKNLRPHMPSYKSHVVFPAVVYVENEVQGRVMRSNTKDLTCLATESGLTSITGTWTLPDSMVTIQGYGLDQIQSIVFEPDPGQENLLFNQGVGANDITHHWKIISASGGYLCAQVIGSGISAPIHGQVHGTYKVTEKTNNIPFTLTPRNMMVYLYEPYSTQYTVFTKKDGGDNFVQKYSDTKLDPNATYYGKPWIEAHHYSDWISGHGGDDIYVLDFVLKNGWKLMPSLWAHVPIDLNGHYGVSEPVTYLDDNGRPAIKMHWWVDASNHETWYQVVPQIFGPMDVPFR
jgi:hypothetical protein